MRAGGRAGGRARDLRKETLLRDQEGPGFTMPTRVFVNILQARSLPVMDRSTGLCDAYVKPQLKGVTFEPVQTQVIMRVATLSFLVCTQAAYDSEPRFRRRRHLGSVLPGACVMLTCSPCSGLPDGKENAQPRVERAGLSQAPCSPSSLAVPCSSRLPNVCDAVFCGVDAALLLLFMLCMFFILYAPSGGSSSVT